MKEISRGEIYYADLSDTVGSEQEGQRPVLILQNDKGNQYSTTTIVAAITSSKKKKPLPTHVSLTADGLEKRSIVLLEQLRTVDIQRLGRYVGTICQEEMDAVDKAAAVSLGLKIQEETHDDR